MSVIVTYLTSRSFMKKDKEKEKNQPASELTAKAGAKQQISSATVALQLLNKEKEKLEKEIDRVEKKLSNEKFTSKAPEAVVNEEREKGEKYKEMYKAVVERIENLKK